MELKLYRHQQEFLDLVPQKHLLAWECGSGKTAAIIAAVKKIARPALIVVPKSLVGKWKREIVKWGAGDCDIVVISKEQFKKQVCKKMARKKVELTDAYSDRKIVVADEAHHFSGYTSALYKTLLAYIEQRGIEYVYLPTATPYRSTPFNIYCLGRLLGKDWNWFKFRETFFTMVKRGTKQWPTLKSKIDGVPVKEYIGAIVRSLGSVVAMSDVVDLPTHIWTREDFEPNREQQEACSSLLDSTPIARLSKVFQILNGSLKGDGYTEDRYFKCEKFDRALELIETHPKLAVVCRHTLEIERFKEAVTDRRVFVLNGQTPKGERDRITLEFNNSDRALIVIQAKVCEGYDLYAPVMMFYSMDWGLVEWTQMIGRPVRLDHLKSVLYINLVYKDTVDEVVYQKVVVEKTEFNAEIYKKEI